MHLALGVMETTRTRPAVGASINRLIAMRCPDPIKLCGNQLFRLVPANPDKGIAAPLFRRTARAVIQPAFPHGGRCDAHRIIEQIDNGRADR